VGVFSSNICSFWRCHTPLEKLKDWAEGCVCQCVSQLCFGTSL